MTFSNQTLTYSGIVILLLLLAVSIILFDTQSIFTEQLISTTTEQTEKEISDYLNPISKQLSDIKNDRIDNSFDYTNESGLNKYFIPILSSTPKISSIKYFDRDGRQYLIYKDKETFVSAFRIEKTFNNEIVWKRWKDASTMVGQWKEAVEYDPVRVNWIKYFKKDARTDSIFWFNLRGMSDFSKGEIDAVTFGNSDSTNKIFGLAIGVKANNLVSSIPEIKLYSNPKIFLLNHNSHILPIIANNDGASRDVDRAFTRDNIQDSVIISFMDNWTKLGSDSVSFALNINEDKWWAQVDPINMYFSKLQLGVIITEADLIFAYLFNTYLLVGFLLASIILITFIFIWKKKKAKAISTSRLSYEELHQFLDEGETERFELKSSLRWDYREERVNKKMEEIIVKSISAFNNAEGGYLVIGIDDDNNVLGLQNDYSTLKKQNSDYFELHLRNLINATFTVRYTARKLVISFLTLDNKEVCIIKIAKGEYPLFFKTTDKNGNKMEKFYIRSGNSSQEISTLTEINNYIGVRFNNN
ncbi:MAG: ATP-binding protein [Melioribacteraceae bacterium]|nr:ATP-binding protein [Melioribacteraceae bacterium]